MKNTEFTSWLAGFYLLSESATLTTPQRQLIKQHIQLCAYAENDALTVTNFMICNTLEDITDDDLRVHILLQFEQVPVITSNELCYFLQGHFELDESTTWTKVQAKIIMEQIDRNVHGLQYSLLKLYYQLVDFIHSDQDIFDVYEVKQELNSVFHHEIDQSYNFDQSRANDIHTGKNVYIFGSQLNK